MGKHKNTQLELLAPAGSYEAFIAAVNAGADAVYMGLNKFNARVMTHNFSKEEYIKALDYAHKRNVKVFLTLNTLILDSEIKEALENVCKLYEAGLDAVIVQDLGMADIIHKVLPDLPLHASTQMSVLSLEQVKVLEELGFKRVVLGRELSIEEIKEISKNTEMEIEIFVHGALCVSVSGQCLMSAMIGNRSANRGECAGPCRKMFSLHNSNGKVVENNRYLLSKKDIFGLDKILALKDAGVDSLKIEGRNKTVEYTYGVVKAYKEALENGYNTRQDKEVLQLFNRNGKSDGYLNGVRYKESISYTTPKNTGLLLGKVEAIKGKYVKIKLQNNIDMHDGIEIISNTPVSTIVTCIRDKNFNIINKKIEEESTVYLGDIKSKVEIGSVVYKTSSASLNERLKDLAHQNLRRVSYDLKVVVKENEKITAYVGSTKIELDYVPEKSKTSMLTLDKLEAAFEKTQDTSVMFNVSANIDEGLFVPVSKLNELRKAVVNTIEESKIIRREIKNKEEKINSVLNIDNKKDANKHNEDGKNNKKINSLYVYRYDKNKDYIQVYENKYNEKLDILYINMADFKFYEQDILKYIDKCKVYIAIPNVTLKNLTSYIYENLERIIKKGVSGVLVGNLGYIDICNELKKKYNIKLIADYSLNITNKYTAAKLKEFGIDTVTPLFESCVVNVDEIKSILPIEVVEDLACVMTTRFCPISSFVTNSSKKGDCKAECSKNNYYMLDEQNKRYDIVTDRLDCITRLIRNKPKQETTCYHNTRHTVIQ